jgi:hypothetical protein
MDLIISYAALSNLRSSASHSATKSDTSHSRSVTPAAIAGLVRSVRFKGAHYQKMRLA